MSKFLLPCLSLLVVSVVPAGAQTNVMISFEATVLIDFDSPLDKGDSVMGMIVYDPEDAMPVEDSGANGGGEVGCYEFDSGNLVVNVFAGEHSWSAEEDVLVQLFNDFVEGDDPFDEVFFDVRNTSPRSIASGCGGTPRVILQLVDDMAPAALLSSVEMPDAPGDIVFEQATETRLSVCVDEQGGALGGGYAFHCELTSFTIEVATPVEAASWGGIKAVFRSE